MLRMAARSLCMPSLSKAASISDEEIVPLESASNACNVCEPADAQAVAKALARIPSNHAAGQHNADSRSYGEHFGEQRALARRHLELRTHAALPQP
jgi:hypothetical protein